MSTEKKSFSKRVLSAALAAVMAVPMLTATAFAVDRSQILTEKLPDAVMDVSYAVQVETTRAEPVWKSSRLPNGLTIDSATGIISGTPIGSGEYDLQICDSLTSEAKIVHLSILTDTTNPDFITEAMDAATAGKPYRMVMEADGGALCWDAKGLPEGLEINASTGVIKGTAKTSGDYFVKVTAENDKSRAEHEFTLRVGSSLDIATTRLKDGDKGVRYSTTVKTTDGTPCTWTAKGLPDGLEMDKDTGTISGVPTEDGTFNVDITAASEDKGTASARLTLYIANNRVPTIVTESLPNATVGESYRFAVQAVGPEAVNWTAKDLPDGLSIDSGTGVISGTPTASGDFKVDIIAMNTEGGSTVTLDLLVKAAVGEFTVSGSIDHGTIKGANPQNLKGGETSEALIFEAAEGFRIASVTINGEKDPSAEKALSYTFKAVKDIARNYKIVVTTERVNPGTFTVSATIDEHGKITGKNPQELTGGETSEALTFEAAKGYRIATVSVDGRAVAVDVNTEVYTFSAVADIDKDYKIAVTTEKVPSREEGLGVDNLTTNPGEDILATNAGGTVKVGNKSDSDEVGFRAGEHTISFKPATGWEHDSTFNVRVTDADTKTIGNFTVKIPSGTTNNMKVAGTSVSSQADWDAMFPDARLSVNGDTVTVRFATNAADLPYQVKAGVTFLPTLTAKDTSGGETSVSDLTVYGEAKSGKKISKITLIDPVTDRKVDITDLARRSNSKGEYFDRDTGDFSVLMSTKIGGEAAKVWIEGNIDLVKKNGYTTEMEMTLNDLPIALRASVTYADRTSSSDKNDSSGNGNSGSSNNDIAMNGGSLKYDYDEKVFTSADAGNLTIKNIVKKGTSSKAFTFALDFPADADGEYRIRGAVTGWVEDGDTITLYAGEQVTIFDLPEGTKYKVIEKDPGSKYTTSFSVSNGDDGKDLDTGYFTIKDGKVTTVTFTNVGSETTTTVPPVVNNGTGKNNPHTGR